MPSLKYSQAVSIFCPWCGYTSNFEEVTVWEVDTGNQELWDEQQSCLVVDPSILKPEKRLRCRACGDRSNTPDKTFKAQTCLTCERVYRDPNQAYRCCP